MTAAPARRAGAVRGSHDHAHLAALDADTRLP